METVDFGRISIEIPADCPDKEAFAFVVEEALWDYFGTDKHRAEFCKAEFDRCQEGPASFRESAQFRLSPGADAWDCFLDRVETRISDAGTYEGAAIPGWTMPPVQSRLAPKAERQQAAAPVERKCRLDQMTIIEPGKGRGR